MKTLEIIGKMQKNKGVILIKLLISQLLVSLNCQTWFKIDAKTKFLYTVVQYTNDLILLFMNVIWNIRNNRKMQKNKGYTCKITYISAACYLIVANWIPY